jgi:YHS domain-containing protein
MDNARSTKNPLDRNDHKLTDSLEQDPVCSMAVGVSTHKVYSLNGKNYRFCSDGCLKKFKDNPEKYITFSAYLSRQAFCIPSLVYF